MSNQSENAKKVIMEKYLARTKNSCEYYDRAKKYLPGGDTRSAAFYQPYPFCAESGKGCIIHDIDGNEYVDFVNNFTSLVHGHAHPEIVKVVEGQARKGFVHGTTVEAQYELSKILCDRIPDVDLIRYCNSGSEATLYAMRAARNFTGKDGFIRIDGGYNGCHDAVEVNIMPDLTSKGLPVAKIEKGIPKSVLQDIHVVPFNDLEAMETVLKENEGTIAGIIMEPFLCTGGLINPEPGYLAGVRKLADKYGVILVIDEIVALRLHTGGLHTKEGVRADLVTMGKIMGGGFPVGAFGGRKDIMQMFDPGSKDTLSHSGTFSGNAMTMAAGLKAMQLYTPDEIDRINNLGDRIRSSITSILKDAEIEGLGIGIGSIIGISFASKICKTSRERMLEAIPKMELAGFTHLAMLNNGISFIQRGMLNVSTAMQEKDIDRFAEAFRNAIKDVKPIAEECILK